MRDEKLHAVVARSTFASKNVQNTSASDHFWKLRCRKSARRCGAKHISKSKCTKHTRFGPLLEVEMSKKCTPLWREAHFQVKMYKTPQLSDHFWKLRCRKVHAIVAAKQISKSKCTKHTMYGHFWRSDVEKVHAVVARSKFRSQNVKTLGVRTTFGGSDVEKLQDITLHYTPVHYITLHTLHYTPVRSTNTKLHCTTLHYTE